MSKVLDIGNKVMGGLAGVGFQGIGQAMQGNYSRGMMDYQQRLQNQNSKYLSDLALRNWRETNFPAQVEQMKKAGLNVGLMSGGGGSPGQSVSPTQNVSGQQANNFMGIGLDAMKLQSEIKMNEAGAKKLEAEAKKTSGVDTEMVEKSITKILSDIDKNNAEIKFKEALQDLSEFELDFKEASMTDELRRITSEADLLENKVYEAQRDNMIGDATKDDVITGIKREVYGKYLDNVAKKAGIHLTETQTWKLTADIFMAQSRLEKEVEMFNAKMTKEYKDLNISQKQLKINEFVAKETSYIGRGKLGVEEKRVANEYIRTLLGLDIGSSTTTTRGVDTKGNTYESQSTTKRNY